MKRPCRDIEKIMWMKWRLLAFTEGAVRRPERFHSLKKPQIHPNQMNLKSYQGQQGLSMTQVRKNRELKKHQSQAIEKDRYKDRETRPYSLKRAPNRPD